MSATEESVVLLPREIRLVAERLLLLTALPAGLVPAVRDVVFHSAIAGLGGIALLVERIEALKDARPAALRIEEPEPGRFAVDGSGQHAWVALPSVLDLAGEAVARHGSGVVTVGNVADPEELLVAAALGRRQAMLAFAAVGPATISAPCAERSAPGLLRGGRAHATIFAAPLPAGSAEEPLLTRALREGLPVPAALWWRAHHLSNTALSPDSIDSRRHAGPVMVLPDGTVIGRKDNDDDTDFSLLTRGGQHGGAS